MKRRVLVLVLAIAAACACTRVVVLAPPVSDAGHDAARLVDAPASPDGGIDAITFDAGAGLD